jgi:hypothetical protein
MEFKTDLVTFIFIFCVKVLKYLDSIYQENGRV